METQSTPDEPETIWESEAEARFLEQRLNSFWNTDYFTKILLPLLDLKPGSRVLRPGGTFMAAEYHTLFCDLPIEADRLQSTDDELSVQARFTKLVVQGYRASGQGNLKLGSQVPFLAVNAGLRIVDVRINDRVSHAFPPYNDTAQMGLAELQGFEGLIQDPGYQAWLKGALVAGGGTEADFEAFLNLFRWHSPEAFAEKTDFSFVWLFNPVLLVTVARKG